MVLTNPEIDSILNEIEANFGEAYLNKDVQKLLEFYHPQALIVQRGGDSAYGHNEIKKYLKECFKEVDRFGAFDRTRVSVTTNGEFLIKEGIIECIKKGKSKKYGALSIFKRMDDGSYKYYRDDSDKKPYQFTEQKSVNLTSSFPLNHADIERILKEIEAKFYEAYTNKDINKILDFYHSDALITARGDDSAYGKDLKYYFKECFKEIDRFGSTEQVKISATIDGEYIIREAIVEGIKNGQSKKYDSFNMFKRIADGSYQFYRDDSDQNPIGYTGPSVSEMEEKVTTKAFVNMVVDSVVDKLLS
uniref:SnoaL-like domain-containing protein n=1 Tax=Acrobeloides nanus TaxID=290746 RepID=A0A914C7D5_9BILA